MNDRPDDRRTGDALRENTGAIIAILYTLGFFSMVGALLFFDVPTDNHDIMLSLAGSMTTIQVGIVGYYFGSSKNAEVSQKAAIAAKEKADTSLQVIAAKAATPTTMPADTAVITTTETKVATKKGKK